MHQPAKSDWPWAVLAPSSVQGRGSLLGCGEHPDSRSSLIWGRSPPDLSTGSDPERSHVRRQQRLQGTNAERLKRSARES